MTLPFDGVVDDPKDITVIITEGFAFGAAGIILGVLVDKQFTKLAKQYPKYKVPIAALQLVVLYAMISLVYVFLDTEFPLHFQTTLGGLAFPALFFGVQSNIFNVAQETINL